MFLKDFIFCVICIYKLTYRLASRFIENWKFVMSYFKTKTVALGGGEGGIYLTPSSVIESVKKIKKTKQPTANSILKFMLN